MSEHYDQRENDRDHDIEQLLRRLRDRVDERRDDTGSSYGTGPGDSPVPTRDPEGLAATLDDVQTALDGVQHFTYRRDRIDVEGPVHRAMHAAIAKATSHHIQSVLDQAEEQSRRVARTLTLLADVADRLTSALTVRVVDQIDHLQTRTRDEHRLVSAAIERLDDMVARIPSLDVDPWYAHDEFAGAFRGSTRDVKDHYRHFADLFVGSDPVLDIGFGRGEFLDLLRELDVTAIGVDTDAAVVADAQSRGLHVQHADAIEYLKSIPDGSLGGIVMTYVIEHLPPQHVVDVVKLAADKLRTGGRVVVETLNPTSLHAYANTLWVDPTQTRPIHPTFLQFLFEQAGFAQVERVPFEQTERLERLDGDDDFAARVNANLDRINALLFAPDNYAITATR